MQDELVRGLFEMLRGELEGAIASRNTAKVREIFEISEMSGVVIVETQLGPDLGFEVDEARATLEFLLDLDGGDRNEGI